MGGAVDGSIESYSPSVCSQATITFFCLSISCLTLILREHQFLHQLCGDEGLYKNANISLVYQKCSLSCSIISSPGDKR